MPALIISQLQCSRIARSLRMWTVSGIHCPGRSTRHAALQRSMQVMSTVSGSCLLSFGQGLLQAHMQAVVTSLVRDHEIVELSSSTRVSTSDEGRSAHTRSADRAAATRVARIAIFHRSPVLLTKFPALSLWMLIELPTFV